MLKQILALYDSFCRSATGIATNSYLLKWVLPVLQMFTGYHSIRGVMPVADLLSVS